MLRRLFEQKKKKKKSRVVAPNAHMTTLKVTARMFVNLREKKR
jgi:hypothetical protein